MSSSRCCVQNIICLMEDARSHTGPSFQLDLIKPNIFLHSSLLKVLSSEMDPAEIRLIWQVFIKERGAEGF